MSVNDEDLRPKQWQKFDIEGIMHKEFVPPGQAVNGKFCCDVLKWLRDNIWRMCPDKWRNNSRVRNHDSVEAHVLLVVQQCFGFYEYELSPTLPTHRTLPPCDFFLFPKMKLKIKGRRLTELKRSRPNCRTWGRHWCKMSSISASNHEVPLESLYQCQRG